MTNPFVKERVFGTGWFVKPGVKVRGIPSAEAVGTPTLVYNQFVTVPSIPSGEIFGAPELI